MRHEEKPKLAEALLRERDQVAAILRFIRDSGIKVSRAALKPLLKSSDTEVKYIAAELLAQQGDSSAVNVLLPLADGP